MRELEQSLRDLLEHDAHDYDPTSRDRILETIARTQDSGFPRARVWAGVAGTCAVAVTLAVVVGFAVVGSDRANERLSPPTESENPTPPIGQTRQVGLNGVVVTVPASWPTTDAVCDEPATSYVYFDSDIRSSARCPFIERDAVPETIVGVGESDSDVGRAATRHLNRPGQPADGLEVLESAPSCEAPRVVSCFQSFVVPEVGTYFTLRSRGDGALDKIAAIRESLQILPAGTTTVPFTPNGKLAERIADIEATGLQVELVQQPSSEAGTGVFLGADPALGSAVLEGGNVRLTISGDPNQGTSDAESANRLLASTGTQLTLDDDPDSSCEDSIDAFSSQYGTERIDQASTLAGVVDQSAEALLRPGMSVCIVYIPGLIRDVSGPVGPDGSTPAPRSLAMTEFGFFEPTSKAFLLKMEIPSKGG